MATSSRAARRVPGEIGHRPIDRAPGIYDVRFHRGASRAGGVGGHRRPLRGVAVRSSTTCRAEFALASGDAGTAFAETNTGLKPAEEAGAYTLPPDLHVVLAPSAVRQSDTSTGPRFARDLGDERLACECVVRADASSAGGRAVYGGRCAAPDPAPDPAPAPWRAPSPRWPTW